MPGYLDVIPTEVEESLSTPAELLNKKSMLLKIYDPYGVKEIKPVKNSLTRKLRLHAPGPALFAVAAVLLASIGLGGCIVPEREAQDLLPYLQMPTPYSMTIQWRTSTETEGAVRYGETYSLGMEVSDPEPSQWHAFTLTDLSPDTEYLYQAYADGVAVGDVYSFHTAPVETVPFQFAVVGDTMYSHPEKLQIKENILEDFPSFVIHVGDFAGELGGYQESLWREHFFEDYENLMCRIPLIPILGNHEYQGVIMVFFSLPGRAPLFHDYFTLPNNERWFSFDWANCHFIALDTNIPKDLKEGEQYDWLVQDLEKSTDGINDPTWIFACWHEPAFSSGAGQFDLMGKDLRERYAPLMESYGVDIVFYGHDHFYERSYKDGVYYIVTGGGGAAPHPIFEDINPHSQLVVDAFQYMRVTVNGLFLQVESVDPMMTVLDSFTLEKEPPPVDQGAAGDEGSGCGCSVVEEATFFETPVTTALLLIGIFGFWYYRRLRVKTKRNQ